MNPDTQPTSDWMQPVRPMRILFKSSEENRHWIYIFAIRTVGTECEYLSIDGISIWAQSKSCYFAETLIEGQWLRLGA